MNRRMYVDTTALKRWQYHLHRTGLLRVWLAVVVVDDVTAYMYTIVAGAVQAGTSSGNSQLFSSESDSGSDGGTAPRLFAIGALHHPVMAVERQCVAAAKGGRLEAVCRDAGHTSRKHTRSNYESELSGSDRSAARQT